MGPIPQGLIIDHDDRDRTNNRIGNLNLTTYSGNQKNVGKHPHNKTGVTGVSWDTNRKKWYCSIQVNGKSIGLGRYTDWVDAVSARKIAENVYGFHRNHGQ